MPDGVWIALVFLVPAGLILGIRALLVRRGARFSSDESIADVFAAEDGTFALTVPAATPVGIYAEYSISAVQRGGGGISYGLVLRCDVVRPGYEQRGEYLIGQAQRLFGEVPEAQTLDMSTWVRNGLDIRRTLLLARVPAGEPIQVSGKVKRTGGDGHTLHVFAKPIA